MPTRSRQSGSPPHAQSPYRHPMAKPSRRKPAIVRFSPAKAEKLAEVRRRLLYELGPLQTNPRGRAIDVFFRVVLSQNTSYPNAREGYRRLKRDLPTWKQVMAADASVVQRAIAVCGLGRMRAYRILAMLRKIEQDFGRLTLGPVGRMPLDEATAYLSSFHGVGPRTVNCTLLFGFDFPIFPVDNGILRVLRRLRIVPAKTPEDQVREVVEKHVDGRDRYAMHVLTYKLAKSHCRPRNPLCRDCPLLDLCPTGEARLKHRPAKTEPPPIARPRKTSLATWASGGVGRDERDDDRRQGPA